MIELKYLSKTFQMKDGAVKALQNINLTIPDGAIYGIIGMSGAGKSTLVRCINLLERPTGGSVVIDGVAMETLSPASLRKRRREITMIFQQFNLLMQRTCLKNVCFPMELAGVKKAEAEKRAMELLEMVGLPDKAWLLYTSTSPKRRSSRSPWTAQSWSSSSVRSTRATSCLSTAPKALPLWLPMRLLKTGRR